MWDSFNNDEDSCHCPRKAFARCNSNQDKENVTPTKSEDLSMYDSNSPIPISCAERSPSYRRPINRLRSLDEHDSNSQDSGYSASYQGEFSKFVSYNSATHDSFNSFGSLEDEFLEDFSDVEPLEKTSALPVDFNKLINNPLRKTTKENRVSPKDHGIRPLFRRALSLYNASTSLTPNSSKVRTSLFKSSEGEVRSFKRPEPPTPIENSLIKRSKLFDDDCSKQRPVLQRAFSATEESIMCAVQRSSTEPDLIGDFSKIFCLPLTKSKHQDLKAISADTLTRLMNGEYSDEVASFKVIDCRYPYEFEGGHIDGALNIYTKEQCQQLLNENVPAHDSNKRHILVFHCEFSSERGPNLYRYLRKEDRQKNESLYPSLNYPEIYLLEGGYKSFFHQHSTMCTPKAYKEMLHPDHENDLRHFRQKSKTWNADTRVHRPQYRDRGIFKRL